MNQNTRTMPTANGGGRKFRNDLIFILALLLVVSLAGLALYHFRGEGDTVVVEVDGAPYGTYPLSKEMTLEIRTGEAGENVNLLVIRDGKAMVTEASCPDGICAAHKAISREGESIVCLPHKVVITVRRVGDHANEPDVVV